MLEGLRSQNISDEQEESLIDFARKISAGLECADSDFPTRCSIIETLGIEVTLSQRERTKTLQIKCVLGKGDKVHYVQSPNVLEDMSDKKL